MGMRPAGCSLCTWVPSPVLVTHVIDALTCGCAHLGLLDPSMLKHMF